MKHNLSLSLSSQELKALAKRFHFEEKDFPLLEKTYHRLLPMIDAYFLFSFQDILPSVDFQSYCYGLVTLGKGIDELVTSCLEKESIQEAYMIDCISLGLLDNAYSQCKTIISEHTKLFVTELHFLGDFYPMDLLPIFFETLQPEGISVTSGNMLLPLKTVALILPLSEDSADAICMSHSCASCKNTGCSMRSRPQTYGVQEIFHTNLSS